MKVPVPLCAKKKTTMKKARPTSHFLHSLSSFSSFSLFRLSVGLLLGLTLASAALAAPSKSLSQRELASLGIYPAGFQPLTYIDEQRLFLGLEEPSVEKKQNGVTQRVWLLRFDANFKVDSAQKFELRLPQLEQARVAADGKSLLIAYKRGANIDRLDLNSGKLTTISEHVSGTPGFRLDPSLIFSYGNKNYCTGYRYDASDVTEASSLAEIDPAKSGAAAFTTLRPLAEMQGKLGRVVAKSIRHPEAAFLVQQGKGGEGRVLRWNSKLASPEVVDTGIQYGGLWGAGEFGLFAMKHGIKNYDLTLANALTGDKKVVAHSEFPLSNPVLSDNGKTWVGLERYQGDLYRIVAGTEDKPGPTHLDEKLPPTVLRLSNNGKTLVAYSPEGLRFYKIP